MRRALALVVAFGLCFPAAGSADGPVITPTITAGVVGDNGWYRSDVTVKFTVDGATDTNCPAVKTFTATTPKPWSCTATAPGFTQTVQLGFNIDTDPPTVTGATTDRPPDRNGWFNHPVSVSFAGSDAGSGIASCTSASYAGPDAGSATLTGTCRDNAGNVSSAGSFAIAYDATPPTVTAAPARRPDANGWFNHPVAVSFAGTDGGSGIDSCTAPATYAGPSGKGLTVTGSCTDKAGNTAATTFTLDYDATAPQLNDVAVALGDRTATISWKQPADTTWVAVTRTPGRNDRGASVVYEGRASSCHDAGLATGVEYRYTLRSRDQAGNVAVSSVSAKLRALYAPAAGATVRAGAVLAWVASPGASYYNVQLFLRGRKVLSAWPVGPSLRLPRTWRWAGTRRRLTPGRYRWYVWPGRGVRAKAAYGPLLGSSAFRV